MFKCFILTLAASFVLSFSAPSQSAQAGIAVLAAGAIVESSSDGGTGEVLMDVGIGTSIASWTVAPLLYAAFTGASQPYMGMTAVYTTILLLDADGSLPKERLQAEFSKKYPFIDNSDVVKALATAVKSKYNENHQKDGASYVRISHNEMSTLLMPADLTEEQIAIVARDLE